MSNVEVAESRTDAAPASAPKRWSSAEGFERSISVGLSMAATVLAVLAPFRAVFTAAFSEAPGDREQIVDGWGNTPPSSVLATHHGANFGLLLVICAAALLVAPALSVLSARRPRSGLDLRLLGCAVAVPAALAGVVAGLIAYAGGYEDQVKDLAMFRGRGRATVDWGACLWLSLAAGVCAIAAGVVIVRAELRRAARASRAD